MTYINKRQAPRVTLRMPCLICFSADTPQNQHACESVDFSKRGMCVTAKCSVPLRSDVQVDAEIPANISGRQTTLLRYTGQVVWVKNDGPRWRFGIRFVSIETLAMQPSCDFRLFLQQGDPKYPVNLRLKLERQ